MNRNHFELEQQMRHRNREIEQAARETWMFQEEEGRKAKARLRLPLNIMLILNFFKKKL